MNEMSPHLGQPLARQWRYPELLAVAHGPAAELLKAAGQQTDGSVAPEVVAAAEAWLFDLSHPPRDLGQSISRLLARHQFGLAEQLANNFALLAAEGLDGAQVRREVADAKAGAVQEQRRDEHMLAARARAAGMTVTDWEVTRSADVEEAEKRTARELLDRLAELSFGDADFERRVTECVKVGEYATAGRLLNIGPGEEVIGGPESVHRPFAWPYRESVGELLSWYGGGETAPDFNLRQPLPDDDRGWALVAALQAVWAELTPDTARAVGDAIDGLIADIPVGHPPDQLSDGGFAVQLRGLNDQRFQWLGLSSKVKLQIGAKAPAPSSDMTLWLPLTEDPIAVQGDIAVVTVRNLLELAAPRTGRKTPNPSARRINLIRLVCRQLPPEMVVKADLGDLGQEVETREAVGWMFDLLGLRSMAVVRDALVYDASGMPAAIGELVRVLGTRAHRPGDVSHQHLKELRTDTQAIAQIRGQVTAALGGDLNALVVLGALILSRSDASTKPIDQQTLVGDLVDLSDLADDERTPGPGAPQEQERSSTGYIDVEGGLRLLAAAGLIIYYENSGDGGRTIRFRGPGLAALLADNGLLTETVENIHALQDRWKQERTAARIALGQRTSHAYRHLRRNYDFALAQLVAESRRDDLSLERQANVFARIDRVQERIRSLNLIEQDKLEELRAQDFDMHDLLAEVRRIHDYAEATISVDVAVAAGTPAILPVRGIRELVELAIDDLIVNADRAMDRANSSVRQLKIEVRCGDREIERIVVLDLEDSGPGFGALPSHDEERRGAGLAGGEGLDNARRNLASCRGELEILKEPSQLGGAHIRIVLPVSEQRAAATS
jgi:hypothetical protein